MISFNKNKFAISKFFSKKLKAFDMLIQLTKMNRFSVSLIFL